MKRRSLRMLQIGAEKRQPSSCGAFQWKSCGRRGRPCAHRVHGEASTILAALAFINLAGAIAEQQGHHPEIHNVWNQVTLRLCTHDAGNQITEKDLTLARALQSLSLP